MKKKKSNFQEIQEKAMNWLWVVLLISAIMFLRGLLSDMNIQTNRLSEERKLFQKEMDDERIKSKELYQGFYAQINQSVEDALRLLDR